MIGGDAARRIGTVLVIAAAVSLGMGLRPGDPSQADPSLATARRQQLGVVAAAADHALAELSTVLGEALDHGRRGAARTVAGDAAPAAELEAAADRLSAGVATADATRRTLLAVAGTAAAVDPGSSVPAPSYAGPELELIAAQLRASAAAATAFVERRHATEAVVAALGEALAALERDEPAAAIDRLDATAAPLALLEAWEDRPPLLRYWLTVTRDLTDAARGIATATIAGDPAEVQAAAQRYAQAAALASGADNALAVSLSEAGAAVSSAPLQRLAAAAAEAEDLRAALQPFLRSGS